MSFQVWVWEFDLAQRALDSLLVLSLLVYSRAFRREGVFCFLKPRGWTLDWRKQVSLLPFITKGFIYFFRNLLHPQVPCVFGLVQRSGGGLAARFHVLTQLSSDIVRAFPDGKNGCQLLSSHWLQL
jgi:hypothetical protein